jgi:Rad3-related DNA helicase
MQEIEAREGRKSMGASPQDTKYSEAEEKEARNKKEVSILNYFPKHLTPRKAQIDALKAIEKAWDTSDVIVVNMPVGAGKSAVSITVSRWASSIRVAKKKDAERGRVGILASNNMLVDQYLKDYPSLQCLHAGHRYTCNTTGITIKERKIKKMGLCHPEMYCGGCTKYKNDSRRIYSAPYALLNYHMYFALKFFKHFNCLIVDEAHNLINLLQDLGSSKVFQHTLPKDYRYPDRLNSVQQLRDWLDSLPDELLEESASLQHFKKAAHSNKYIFREGEEEYRGELRHCLKLLPIDLTEEPQIFFPSRVNKIVLLSATISSKDIEQMGLYRRKVSYFSATSPIPAENRPVYCVTPGLNMSYQHQDKNLPELAEMVLELAKLYPGDKGLIHTPYSLAWKLRSALKGREPRLLFHDKENKLEVYKKFRNSEEPYILVASGMYEGIDLPYEAARFQAITKVPYPSLADPAIKFKADRDPSYYAWETIKQIIQATGRVVRAVDDYGATYVLDNSFQRLYHQNLEVGYFPEWFQESVQEVEYER